MSTYSEGRYGGKEPETVLLGGMAASPDLLLGQMADQLCRAAEKQSALLH